VRTRNEDQCQNNARLAENKVVKCAGGRMKPNQEIIEWHECSEWLPTDSGHYLILCEDGDVYIDWFNNGSDEAGNPEDHCPWGDPEWLIEVQDPGAYKVIAWAYLPKGVTNE